MSAARRRLLRDFKKLQEDPPLGCSGAPLENNLLSWNCIIFGPQGTPFEDGTFRLGVDFSEDYPNKPPKVRFLSKMFHPNVYADGSICLDILNTRWSPSYDVASILTSIQSLLDMPNPNSPANSLAAQLYQTDRREYDRRVVAIVEQSWLEADGGNDDGGEHCKKSVVDSTADAQDEEPSSTTTTATVAVAVDGGESAPANNNDSLVIVAADDAAVNNSPIASTSNARGSLASSSSHASTSNAAQRR